MSRFFAFALSSVGVGFVLALGVAVGCSSSDVDASDAPDASAHKDSAIVDPTEAGEPLDAPASGAASCVKYCDLVMTNCTGEYAQYANVSDCVAFCAHLPLEDDAGGVEGEQKSAATVGCREYWADSPARTDPKTYCLSAGPFGGNACGDRCTAFCDVVLDSCSELGPSAPYASHPECATACANFTYRDAGTDGGGEAPYGPDAGDSLNCRLYFLRAAADDPQGCAKLVPDAGPCQNR